MGGSHSNTDWISWRNFWRLKCFLFRRVGTGYLFLLLINRFLLFFRKIQQVKYLHNEDSWICPGSGVKGMQTLRSRTFQHYQQLQKKLILFQLSSVRADMTTPSYLRAYDQIFLSAAIQVLHKPSKTIHPSPHASITCILTTKQGDSKSAHTDRGLDSCWSGCGGFSHILNMEEATK